MIMHMKTLHQKRLTRSTSGIVLILFGVFVLLIGLIQIPKYFQGINPIQGSTELSVPADPVIGMVQIFLTVATLATILALFKLSGKFLGSIAFVALTLVLLFESMMAIGYSGS